MFSYNKIVDIVIKSIGLKMTLVIYKFLFVQNENKGNTV